MSPSSQNTQFPVQPWVEREFPDATDIIRFDAGYIFDTGYYWDQVIGVQWAERTFKSAASSRARPNWSRR